MRITVGGALLLIGTGAFVVLGPLSNMMEGNKISLPLESLQRPIDMVMSYFKKDEIVLPVATESKPAEPATNPTSVPETPPASETPGQPIPIPTEPVAATPAPAPVAVQKAPEEPVKLSQSQRVTAAAKKHRLKK